MATVIIMPKQGQSVESCIITDMKKKGDKVSKGDILFAYETDKASFEEEAPVDGVVLETFFSEGDEVPVLTNVMVLGAEGESVEGFRPGGETAAPAAIAEAPKTEAAKVETKPQSAPVANRAKRQSGFHPAPKNKPKAKASMRLLLLVQAPVVV
jgi:pyruvate dehydrogenase E2 component (dihydrolipoamide acetyltransferase)